MICRILASFGIVLSSPKGKLFEPLYSRFALARFINSWFESNLGTKRICLLIKKLTGYYPMSFM
jgi:hypothetical protein